MSARADIQAHYGPGSPTLALLLDAFAAQEQAKGRAAGVREAADIVDNEDTCDCGGCDSCQQQAIAADLRARADTIEQEHTP